MPWKVVTRHGKNMGTCSIPSPCGAMTLAEAVDGIKSTKEERERKKKLKRSIKNIMRHI